jgi:hypothetical protein
VALSALASSGVNARRACWTREPAGLELQAELLGALGGRAARVARLGHAGQVALDVGHEHRHAGRGQLLGDPLQRLGLAGAGGAGDQAVAVDHPQRQLDRGRGDNRAIVHAAAEIERGPVGGVRGRDRLREVGHVIPPCETTSERAAYA